MVDLVRLHVDSCYERTAQYLVEVEDRLVVRAGLAGQRRAHEEEATYTDKAENNTLI